MKPWKDKFLEVQVIADMENIFRKNFLSYFKDDEDVVFEGYYSENTLFITATLKNLDESFLYPFEAKISFADNPNLKTDEARLLLLNFIGQYFEEYFINDRNIYIPIDWLAYVYEENKIYAKAQILNKKLENLANELLAEAKVSSNKLKGE